MRKPMSMQTPAPTRGSTATPARISTSMAASRWVSAVALAFLLLSSTSLLAPPAQAARPLCDARALERDVRHLSSDAFGGRGLGSEHLDRALREVATRFAALGLEPAAGLIPPQLTRSANAPAQGRDNAGAGPVDSRDPLAGYFQPFTTPDSVTTMNVIGILRGRGSPAPSSVVVGAHVDHLGTDPSLAGDQIYNGADDNASGVAALLELARSLSRAADEGERSLRDVIFIAFSAEESGLLGSEHYCEHPVVPHSDVMAMVNFDEIGRLEDDPLILFGTGTAKEFEDLLTGLNAPFGLDLVFQSTGAGGSDHNSFFAKDIPVLHFFTGTHADYSKVSDEADRVDYAGLHRVSEYAAELVRYLRYREMPLSFIPAGRADAAKVAGMMGGGTARGASLGFAPDFAGQGDGVKVGRVTPGGAAERAGILEGDVITAIAGEPVLSLADYALILRMHAPGELVSITAIRNGQTLQLETELQERR